MQMSLSSFLTSIVFLVSCSESSFKGGYADPPSNEQKRGSINEGGTDSGTNEPIVETSEVTQPFHESTDKTHDPASCWFVVDGAFFGIGVHTGVVTEGSTFPLPNSSKPIRTGDVYSPATGGIFLGVQDQPYEYRKGKGEIDRAIDGTFDSIAIPPGVNAEVRDELGKSIFTGEGPFMALSDTGDQAPVSKILHALADRAPSWMANHLAKLDYVLPKIKNLRQARSVKVSKIFGKTCG